MNCLTKEDKLLIDMIKSSSPSLGSLLEKRLSSKVKSVFDSKINYVGLVISIFGVISDPGFKAVFGDIISPNLLGKLICVFGFIVMILRTFAKNPKIYLGFKKSIKKSLEC